MEKQLTIKIEIFIIIITTIKLHDKYILLVKFLKNKVNLEQFIIITIIIIDFNFFNPEEIKYFKNYPFSTLIIIF